MLLIRGRGRGVAKLDVHGPTCIPGATANMEIITTSSTAGEARAPTASPRSPAWSGGGATLSARLRRVLEQLSGYDLSDVRVYADSPWPAHLGARAFVFGSNVHLSPGAEDALQHEAWHVVQQKQGRVRATGTASFDEHRLGVVGLNDEEALAREAEVTISGVEITDAARLQEEIKLRLYLMGHDVVGFATLIADMLRENLVFKTWRQVRRELRVREVGYQVETSMRPLAGDQAQRFLTASTQLTTALNIAPRASSRERDAIADRSYSEVGVIRWDNPGLASKIARKDKLLMFSFNAHVAAHEDECGRDEERHRDRGRQSRSARTGAPADVRIPLQANERAAPAVPRGVLPGPPVRDAAGQRFRRHPRCAGSAGGSEGARTVRAMP